MSIFHAACSVISRAACICAAESAIQFWTVCLSASSEPCACGSRARSQSMSNARRETPSQRMQWWMRPGPSRCWAIRKPAPRGAEQRVLRHAHALVEDLGVAADAAEVLGGMLHRRDVAQDPARPGVSAGTMNIEARWCGGASGSVTAMTIRKSATEPLEENHLWPSITQRRRRRPRAVASSVGSEPAVSGSVIENAERRSPASSG